MKQKDIDRLWRKWEKWAERGRRLEFKIKRLTGPLRGYEERLVEIWTAADDVMLDLPYMLLELEDESMEFIANGPIFTRHKGELFQRIHRQPIKVRGRITSK